MRGIIDNIPRTGAENILELRDLYHTTSLHHAASYNASAVRLLIDRYHDRVEDLLESRDLCGNTPIHRSASSCPNALL